ncbi:MAG: glycosyltransferase family 2 protein [Deltaproteobacteria bacterium]|jgi:glycosyltransferase involved in cell wall biosynthesis|nr:glycosyltransferase family 2 protein [Deltaproteobacteria bacterium]
MTLVSVVIPAYRSEKSLPALVCRLEAVLSGQGSPFEVIIVDDSSPDGTWAVLKELASSRPFLRIARLMRNSGQHKAVMCGMELARGDRIVTMDDDLQNPPEEIPKLLAALDEGYCLAIASYGVKRHSLFRNLCGSMVDFSQKKIFGLPGAFRLTSFRAFTGQVSREALAMASGRPHITSMLLSSSDSRLNVPTRHMPRAFGKSNYSLKKGVSLCLDLWLAYSPYPLYLVLSMCLLSLCLAAAFASYAFWQALSSDAPSGWASLFVAVSFFSGLILLSLTVHGVYLSRLAAGRPRLPVAETIQGGWGLGPDLPGRSSCGEEGALQDGEADNPRQGPRCTDRVISRRGRKPGPDARGR